MENRGWEPGMQRVCLYFQKLALVQHRPAAPQTELTDVVVTDISPLRLPPVRPYEYLPNARVSVETLLRNPLYPAILYIGNAGSV